MSHFFWTFSLSLALVYAVFVSTATVYKERRLTEPALTGARLNAFEQAALVYTRLLSIWNMLPFLSQLTNVNRFSKVETTETAIELACCMVSD